jgi:hypothetical protein
MTAPGGIYIATVPASCSSVLMSLRALTSAFSPGSWLWLSSQKLQMPDSNFTSHSKKQHLWKNDRPFVMNVFHFCYSVYRVSQEECDRLRESVPYVKVYRYNPKHLYPKLNGYEDNGQRKMRSSCGSTYCTCSADALRVHCACLWGWNAVNIVPALRTVSYL